VLAHRFGTGWNGAPMREFGDHHWNEPMRWNRRAADAGTTPRVFPSMCDPFDKNWPAGVRTRFFELIERTPHLCWLLLTKRIGNVARMLEEQGLSGLPSNVWIGATIVNQEEADRDIPKLLAVPAAKHFLSMEPLLGAVDLETIYNSTGLGEGQPYLHPLLGWVSDGHGDGCRAERIDWVIVGGESGHGARPMHPDWARSLRDQCQAAGVPFLFKQWGEWAPYDRSRNDGAALATPNALDEPLQRFGKAVAGRLLDGRTWDGVPS
jgi:protein gp37